MPHEWDRDEPAGLIGSKLFYRPILTRQACRFILTLATSPEGCLPEAYWLVGRSGAAGVITCGSRDRMPERVFAPVTVGAEACGAWVCSPASGVPGVRLCGTNDRIAEPTYVAADGLIQAPRTASASLSEASHARS